jgi:hypothetical protein
MRFVYKIKPDSGGLDPAIQAVSQSGVIQQCYSSSSVPNFEMDGPVKPGHDVLGTKTDVRKRTPA